MDQGRPAPTECLYRLGKELGKGTYSVVRVAQHIESKKLYAAKVIDKNLMRGREHLVRNEVVVLRRISTGCDHILSMVDYFETESSLYFITELCRGGELFDRVYEKRQLEESEAAKIIREVSEGVCYLHSHGIVHRDLKLENVLFKNKSDAIRIADFGLSRIVDEEHLKVLMTTCGTTSYMAPEIFTKQGHGKPVDIWAIGILTYFVLAGYTPFEAETPAQERQAILKGEYDFSDSCWDQVSDSAKNFIGQCLQAKPEERITATQCLEHPFLTGVTVNANEDDDHMAPSKLEGSPMHGAYSRTPINTLLE